MGLGRFGGGAGVARFLAEDGAHVTVTDLKKADELCESLSMLNGLGIRFVLGRHEMNDFISADMVVVNPAVPRNSEYVLVARKAGTILQTEVGLFVQHCQAPVCGVTGSNGKTTVVSMIQSILSCSDRTFWIGGNIGGSLLSSIPRISSDDIVVLELSSFQLEWLGEMKWSPHIAAVLNLTPNHLDRHGSFESYKRAKGIILDYQKAGDRAVLVRDDPEARALSYNVRSSLTWVGINLDRYGITLSDRWVVRRTGERVFPKVDIFDTNLLAVPGRHNLLNAMTAVACTLPMGMDKDAISQGLASFRGLEHRLEFVGERNGIAFYNDSKATTPESTVAAVNAFDRYVIPILGGDDKGVVFDNMASQISDKIQWAALIGTTAPAISVALEKAGVASTIFSSLKEAVSGCISHARDGDIIIMTPGCASYDMFDNYEERGEQFKSLVYEHVKKRRK